jgi:hypothetical protein
MLGLPPQHDLSVQLGHIPPESLEQAAPLYRDTKHLARSSMASFPRAPKPAVLFHARQRRIKSPWAQTVAMLGEFLHQPGTPYVVFGRVMEDVNLPDSKSDLAVCGGQHLRRA